MGISYPSLFQPLSMSASSISCRNTFSISASSLNSITSGHCLRNVLCLFPIQCLGWYSQTNHSIHPIHINTYCSDGHKCFFDGANPFTGSKSTSISKNAVCSLILHLHNVVQVFCLVTISVSYSLPVFLLLLHSF